MALIECKFFSRSLAINTAIFVIIPSPSPDEAMSGIQGDYYDPSVKYPTLYLLHGGFGDYTDWQRKTRIEEYAEKHKIAVVMPSAENSFYADMAKGNNYWQFISEELPQVARGLFPLSDKKEDNFVAGLSMGGYGAFKMALWKPECFEAAASLSGAVDICSLFEDSQTRNIKIDDAFGDFSKVKGSKNDLKAVIKQMKEENAEIPKLYMACGTEDFIYHSNVRFRDYLNELGVELTYEEGPGVHGWAFWDKYIQNVLDWLPIRSKS